MRKNKLLLLLALLMTAATGARAAWTGGTYTATATENLGAITVNGDATLTINSDVTVTVTGGINIASGTLTVTGPGTLVVTGAKGNDGNSDFDGGPGGTGGVAISGNIIVQGGATVTATGGTGGTGGNGEWDGGTGGNGGVAFAGTLTYKSGTVTANGGSAGSGGWSDDEERYASSGSAGKAFANDVDFTQTTGYSVTNGTSTIGSVLNQRKVVISGGSEPAAATTYKVSMKDDVKDADKWTVKVDDGQTQALPIGGLKGDGTEKVTLQYNGRLKVKGVTATSDEKAAAWDGTITAQLAAKLAYTRGDATDDLTTMTWAVGEHIAILYKVSGTKKVADAEITAVDGTTGAATIQFTVEDGTPDNTPCTLVYPYSAAKDDHTGVKDAATLLAAQDGTLSANLDVRVGAGTIQTTTPGLTVTTQPAAQFAIFKFTTKNANGSATINVKSLKVTIDAQDYVITPALATSELYVALPAVADQAVRFSATGSDSKTYTCSKASVTFAARKYYQSMLKMAPPITVTWNNNDITGSGNSFSKGGVTITAGSIDFDDKSFEENGTFTTSLGYFTKIEVVATDGFCDVVGTGWSGDEKKRTWTGNASSVSFIGDIYGDGNGIKFVFTIEP